jgi:threonine synthase
MSIWKYADRFTTIASPHRITLGEGDTPLLPSRSLGPQAGLRNLFFKLETTNPTGSYKDRFAAAAISDMVAQGKKRCVATSSGNTGSALAAYCAAEDLPCQIAIVETAPQGKLLQMLAYGAQLYRVQGFGIDPQITEQTFERVRQLGKSEDASLQISAFCDSPVGMRGVQTISYELLEQAPQVPDHVFCPAGGGGLTLAIARGFEGASHQTQHRTSPTRIHCVQPQGNNTIASALRQGETRARVVHGKTSISGLQVPNVMDGNEVIAACRASGGTGYAVEDEEVFTLQARLAVEEGIFCEPAAAVAVAGALLAAKLQEIRPEEIVVCLITGSAFKDPPSLERMAGNKPCPTVCWEQLFTSG